MARQNSTLDSTSSTALPSAFGRSRFGKAKTNILKAGRFRAQLLKESRELLSGGISFLVVAAVKPTTRRDDRRRQEVFELALGISLLALAPPDLDAALLEHFEEKCMGGAKAGYGTRPRCAFPTGAPEPPSEHGPSESGPSARRWPACWRPTLISGRADCFSDETTSFPAAATSFRR